MPHGSRLSLTISDTGPGVPDVLRGRIFDPFFTTKPDGSGLGLAISRQIIVDHGGAIEVGRAPGGGAVFTIELPVTAPVSAAEKA
jgi:signal transduction histidine kinase